MWRRRAGKKNTYVNQQAQTNATSAEMDEEAFETVKAAMVAGMPGSSSTNTQNKRPRPQPKQKALPGTEGEPKIEDPTKVEASFNKLINDSRKIYHRQSLEDQDQEWKKAMLEKWQTAVAGLELAFKDFQNNVITADKDQEKVEQACQTARVVVTAFTSGIKNKFKW